MFDVVSELRQQYAKELASLLPLSKFISYVCLTVVFDLSLYNGHFSNVWKYLLLSDVKRLFSLEDGVLVKAKVLSFFIGFFLMLLCVKIFEHGKGMWFQFLIGRKSMSEYLNKIENDIKRKRLSYRPSGSSIAEGLQSDLIKKRNKISYLFSAALILFSIAFSCLIPFVLYFRFELNLDLLIGVASIVTSFLLVHLSYVLYISSYFPLLVVVKDLLGEKVSFVAEARTIDIK